MCDHIGTSHGELHSNGDPNKLVAVIVCGECGETVKEVDELEYKPEPVKGVAHAEGA
jgi:hypothetical protein